MLDFARRSYTVICFLSFASFISARHFLALVKNQANKQKLVSCLNGQEAWKRDESTVHKDDLTSALKRHLTSTGIENEGNTRLMEINITESEIPKHTSMKRN